MVDELAMELVATSQNFSFLAERSLWLAFDGAAAELYVYSDPDGAVAKARKFGESMAKKLMGSAGISREPNFAGGIAALARQGVLPQDVRGLFDHLRREGNAGTHEHSGDSRKALSLVAVCFRLAVWWYQRETGETVGHTFVPPSPERAASLRDLLKKVESRTAELEAMFEAAVRMPQPRIVIGPPSLDGDEWRGGSEVVCGSAAYLVHDPVETTHAADRSWTAMRAKAHGMDTRAENVWLCGLRIHSPSAEAKQLADGMAAQASLLAGPQRHKALPRLVCPHHAGGFHALATSMPGVTWTEKFGYGHPDPLVVQLALDALAEVAGALGHLHRRGQAHRALRAREELMSVVYGVSRGRIV